MLADESMAIEARGLARSFGDVRAIKSVDLDVASGQMHGLIGPDGAGKTTIIRMLCGVLKVTGGSASILGYDLLRQAAEVKRHIGYLSQGFTLYGDLTVDENIAFFARLHGVRDFRRRRDELLDFMRLTPFRRRLGDFLSGGMKKKLALACTLVHTPRLIFLDEPSTGVDPVSRGEFWNILTTILGQGVTVFLTTPYLDEADRCDRVTLLYNGRGISSGRPDDIKAAMAGEVYDVACPRPAEAYRMLRANWPAERLSLAGERLHLRTDRGAIEVGGVADELERQGLGPVRWEKASPSLEDAFVALAETHGTEDRKHEDIRSTS